MRLASSLFLAALLVSCSKTPVDADCESETYFVDADGDGWGDVESTREACEIADGLVSEGGDCNDDDASVFPAAPEQCTDAIDRNCDGTPGMSDNDSDGFAACVDCDDEDSAIHPGAVEICDSVDNDCDGMTDVDAADEQVWYRDNDADGSGLQTISEVGCVAPEGYVDAFGDCDDADPARHPGATEDDCTDPVDYNCDGSVGYVDADKDGYAACVDCDDAAKSVHPEATEVCNGLDDDCQGGVDEAGSEGERTYYPDLDGDTYGAEAGAYDACTSPPGFVELAGDCDDKDAAFHPGAAETCEDASDYNCDGSVTYADADKDGFPACIDCNDADAKINADGIEICNGVDDDCDTEADEDAAVDAATWYRDGDSDTYGDSDATRVACAVPDGYVGASGDCDDLDAAYNPGASELCDDPNDYNCDGSVEYADVDEDGFAACDDCDDDDAAVNDDGVEACNTIDDDCDGEVDEASASDAKTWYKDGDGDSYGDPTIAVVSCARPSGYVADNTDCDDTRGVVHPAGAEVCDSLDNDCDGTVDEAASDAADFYKDGDGDGFGGTMTVAACSAPTGYVTDDTDCDDAKAAIYPGATEMCDLVDNDCDGTVDEADAADADAFYADTDVDGYGDPDASETACNAPSGFVADDSDCDDGDGDISPAADEVCDSVDNDCDTNVDEDSAIDAEVWYRDGDGDTYGDPSMSKAACVVPTGYRADATDCDDTRAAVNPRATEVCNSRDDDCDGSVDPATSADASTWYADADADTYGGAATTKACTVPSGYVGSSTDCDDGSSTVHPGATETCNSVDDDCDLSVDEGLSTTWYPDDDGDGYGTDCGAECGSVEACAAPTGYAASDDDCNDSSMNTYPGAAEMCDGAPNDCDAMSWSKDEEDGLISYEMPGMDMWMDEPYTGTATSPQTLNLADDGTLYVCGGTYYLRISTFGMVEATISGVYGADETFLDAADSGTVITVSTSAGILAVEGLTVQNGSGTGTATKNGGGFVNNGGSLRIADSRITSNTAKGTTASAGSGGGVYASGGDVTIRDTRIDANEAGTFGGGVYVTAGSLTVLDSTIEENLATANVTSQAGGLYYSGTATGSLTVDGVTFEKNKSNGLVSTTATPTVVGGGGALVTGTGTVTITSSVFEANTAGGTGVHGAGGGLLLNNTGAVAATVSDTTFHANTATSFGGGMAWTSSADLGLLAVTFDANTISGVETVGGGGYYGRGIGKVTMDESTVSNNTIATTSTTKANRGAGVLHEGLTTSLGSFKVTDSTFSTNSVTGTGTGTVGGGGLFLQDTHWTLSSSKVFGNTSSNHGGGIYVTRGGSLFPIGEFTDLSSVYGNVTTLRGGGLYLGGGEVTCTGSTSSVEVGFYGNKSTASTGFGGGAFVSGSAANKLTLVNCDTGTTTADDNYQDVKVSDIVVNSITGTPYSYGDDKSAVCTSTSCL